ncbi:MAG: phosphatidylglycerophosphatase A [Erysipelotrichaceae bacterium]|nr:phosphatidylglycerophosphatase A [Erysipelotrichaceae bacterium]
MINHFEECIELLNKRGVTLDDIVECVIYLQKPYLKEINNEEIKETIISVINKREVQHAIITGINIDIASDDKVFYTKDLSKILDKDFSLYGVDEVLAYGICNLYGSIALTNFGYIDKTKPGIIGVLNKDKTRCNTFIDDIIGAIAAAAASKIAHGK